MATIHFSYVMMLGEVYEQLGLGVPQIVVTPDTEGKFIGYVDLQIPRSETVVQTVRCSSSQFPTATGAEQDAARLAMKRLKEECDLQFKDINYDDSLLYKNLYDHQTTNCAVLTTQYSNLSREHSFLKECHVSTVAQKNEYVNERIKLRNAIGECYAVVNRITVELLRRTPLRPCPIRMLSCSDYLIGSCFCFQQSNFAHGILVWY
uniref:Uncharacterized protein n=1 Tax=Ananas comosus var. bracteatus TaxID=296719 RepID=A0A6V7PV07_ANACO|nr:unnamed protein product [Ananas comosus var. bracteatus]